MFVGATVCVCVQLPVALFGIWLMAVTTALEMTAPAIFGLLRALGM